MCRLFFCILKTGATTSITITTTAGSVFVTTADLVIGTTSTIANANVDTVSTTLSTGTLKTVLNGATTSIEILTASDVTFVHTADLVIGTTVVTNTNVNTAVNTGATTTVIVTSALDQTFDTAADLIIGATTIAASGLTTVVSVTVPDAVGTLRTALTGSGMTSIVIDVASSVFFHVYNNLVIDTSITVLKSNLISVTKIGKQNQANVIIV